jgi:pyruvate-formate lyase-activating enzyme
VSQNLKEVNDRIIAANCPAHVLHNAAKKAADKIAVDVKVLVVKLFNHFNSSAKRTAALKSIFAFLKNGEEKNELLRHVTTYGLTFHPAVIQLGQNWPAIKSYFFG